MIKLRNWFFVVFIIALVRPVFGQGGYNDDRVMMQGFMWESHQDGQQTGEGGFQYIVHWREKWYDHVRSKAPELADAKIDLIWLPPPSQGEGAGYHPQQYNDFDNNYGSLDEHRQLIHTLLQKGIEPVADLVINHRNGTGGWATFKNPNWPSKYICSNDEFWFQDPSNLPSADDRAILLAGDKGNPDYTGSNYPNWHGARDLDHQNASLRTEIKAYLKKLRNFGYRGWRYDMVKGFDPKYVSEYDFDSQPTFAVGEFWDSNPLRLSEWIDGTKMTGQPDPALKACSAFDFATFELLRHYINSGEYNHLPAVAFKDGISDGLIAINKNKAVTFVGSHDLSFPQQQFDPFPNNEKTLQAYAYILSHPGVPCIYWKHYFDWGHGGKIKELIRARKYAGVHSGSYIKTEVHDNNYVAIVGDKPDESSTLIVKIGYGFGFKPDENVWGLETFGNGYAVWVRKSKKDATKNAVDATKPALPIP